MAHEPRRHAELIALMVVSGRMRYLVDDRVLVLGPRALLWAHADQSHMLLSESADFDMWVFVIAPETLEPPGAFPPLFAGNRGGPTGARVLAPEAAEALAAVARDLRGAEDRDYLTLGLRWWAARGWSAWRAAADMTGRPVHPAVQTAAQLLRADPERSIAAVARDAGLSRSHLSRLFHAATGQSLTAFRTAEKLKRVDAAMAAGTPPPLLSAALEAGFGSYAQFYRAFRAVRGSGPRAYYR